MKPEWSAHAYRQLRSLQQYIALDSGDEVAWKVATKILETVALLESHPYMGRQSERAGRRELIVGRYVVVYSVHRNGVRVHRAQGGNRSWVANPAAD